MKTASFRFPFWFAALLLIASSVWAQDLGAVRQRMADRLPQLDRQKAEGNIGEDNQGFVTARAGGATVESLASAENADRREVYAAIAQKTGATSASVGQARARQIAAGSAPGVWLQDASGKWYQK